MKQICSVCGLEIEGNDPNDLAKRFAAHLQTHQPKLDEDSNLFGEDEWQEKTADFITFDEKGQELLGCLTGIDEITLHDTKVRRARIETQTGVKSFLLGAQLEPLLLTVPVGTIIKVRYLGEVKSSIGRRVKQYKVWTKKV